MPDNSLVYTIYTFVLQFSTIDTNYLSDSVLYTGCPNELGNSVTNSISSLLRISIVIPYFKSHNIIMSARVYFMKMVKDCKNVSLQDEQ